MRADQIPPAALDAFNDTIRSIGHGGIELYGLSAALAAVLSMPEVRQAIYDDVRRKSDEKLKAMGVTGYSVEWDR